MSSKQGQSGFTLLEIMVTVVLIGIIASFAVLSLPGKSPTERLAEESRRLMAVLEMTRQDALLRGDQRGVYFTEAGYQLMTYQGGRGGQAGANGFTMERAYQLPAGLQLQLWVEGRMVDFKKAVADLPQVLVLSSGEMTPFTVIFSEAHEMVPYGSQTKNYRVDGDIIGHLSMESTK
ncbi:MAG: type II secretion system minor pseudopilin GspH [Candidatus Competibacteraceae bacterium]